MVGICYTTVHRYQQVQNFRPSKNLQIDIPDQRSKLRSIHNCLSYLTFTVQKFSASICSHCSRYPVQSGPHFFLCVLPSSFEVSQLYYVDTFVVIVLYVEE